MRAQRNMRAALRFFSRIHANRGLLWAMARQELRNRYAGTAGGMAWAVAQPLAQIAIYTFVFQVGLKVGTVGEYPFFAVFLCGMLPWLAFSEAVQSSASAVVSNPYLVKQMVFPTEILVIAYTLAALLPHLVLVVVGGGILAYLGYWPAPAIVGLPYFTLCLMVLAIGLGWIVAALNVFLKDVGQAVGILLGIWFWLTPIVWPADALPEWLGWMLTANPFVHIVDGYRAVLLTHDLHAAFDAGRTATFWAAAGILLLGGAHVFRRLKPEFAEVL